jgi:hypothetical protein
MSWLLGLFVVTSLFMISCSDDDSPADNDIFVGKYNGFVAYSNGESSTDETEGWVEVVKVGNSYNFLFSNGIPEITGVEFDSNGETLLNVGATEFQFIRVTASTLDILYTENVNDVWRANCTRN